MSYIGQQPVTGDNNSFRILDSISSYTQTFDGSSSAVVSTANSTLTFTGHRFITGQRVTYSTTGTTIGGLSSGSVYYVIKTDQNTLKLASSYVNALASTSITLTSLGAGSTHTLNVAFDSVNTKFKATFNNGTKGLITRAAQLNISINGVIQQPQDTATPSTGFGIEADSTIVFPVAPAVSDAFWGSLVATNFATFDISDNTVDNFTGNASQTNFVLSKTPANNQNVLVTINGVVQYPSDATNIRAYSVSGNVLIFVGAPGSGSSIQVRHIGFAGATSSSVTGFYGRTGNVGLNTSDTVSIGAATIGTSGIGTSSQPLQVTGGAYVSGSVGIGITNPTAVLHLKAGTATASTAPLKLTSGTNLTTAEAGAIEYNGTVIYSTPSASSGRGLSPSTMLYRVGSSGIVGSRVTTAQSIFGAGLTVAANTVYQFEMNIQSYKNSGAFSYQWGWLFGGTATLVNFSSMFGISRMAGSPSISFPINAACFQGPQFNTSVYYPYLADSNTAAFFSLVVKGSFGVASGGGGTFIPQYQLTSDPGQAFTTQMGSYIAMTPIGIGTGTANISIGAWA